MRVPASRIEHIAAEPEIDPPELPREGLVARAASELFRHESVIERKDLLQRAFELAGLAGLSPDTVEAELAALQDDGRLLRPDDEVRPQRWTTPAIPACEAAMLRSAERPDERDWLAVAAVDAALAAAPHLSGEQRDAVRSVATRDGVALIEAGAGTGKTTTAKALVEAAHHSGLKVVGLSPS
ncbi:AAA family ATPase [Bosea sp. (in: a-proteobacteria)]|uniref:AAA family ATPase n=1 Tax=Bosea sp. (in: a-proteobacteria) TaxID=1871050 RepID=UPI0027362655|nr:AAA family ATPase [Bosea sp. (in: a-proteobacteria)]MDP3411017.1 AAA family ATPase [Bosea sp. (in: a-proteobacteria)]